MDLAKFFKNPKEKTSLSKFVKPTSHTLDVVFDEVALKVLPENQRKLNPLLKKFSQTHFLGGGTAIALQLGHRKSLDFDFFNDVAQEPLIEILTSVSDFGLKLDNSKLNENLQYVNPTEKLDEIDFSVEGVKVSLINFYRYTYEGQRITFIPSETICGGLRTANLLDLATMKLFAMATRNKWKDAVDLFFIIKNTGTTLEELISLSKINFNNMFFEDLVLERLLAGVWNKEESVEYVIENPPVDEEIIDFLKNSAAEIIKKDV